MFYDIFLKNVQHKSFLLIENVFFYKEIAKMMIKMLK